MGSFVRVESLGKCCVIEICPERDKVIFSRALLQEFVKVLRKVVEHEAYQVFVLKGKSGSFCSGIALDEWLDHDSIEESAHLLRQAVFEWANIPRVTITSVDGEVASWGLALVASSDFCVGTPRSMFWCQEVKMGIVPSYLVVFLSRFLSERFLREMLFTGGEYTAHQAYHAGLISHVSPDPETIVENWVAQVLEAAPGALFHTKGLIDALSEPQLIRAFKLAEQLHRVSRESSEAREGVLSLLEKRNPYWRSP